MSSNISQPPQMPQTPCHPFSPIPAPRLPTTPRRHVPAWHQGAEIHEGRIAIRRAGRREAGGGAEGDRNKTGLRFAPVSRGGEQSSQAMQGKGETGNDSNERVTYKNKPSTENRGTTQERDGLWTENSPHFLKYCDRQGS
ncbi:hypothetical protein K438DRAFT_1791678 [Mycena galopus ATCC 62051]|nr:hypothetical protein K438DRAFT_1791678 [Mycena galopus ATCC 62051]